MDTQEEITFISYADEDKQIASSINDLLQEAGIETWFYPKSHKVGLAVSKNIDQAIYRSRRAIILLSKTYIKKASLEDCGLKAEFPALMSEYTSRKFQLIPVRFGTSQSQIRDLSVQLAARDAIVSKDLKKIVEEVLRTIDPEKYGNFVVRKEKEPAAQIGQDDPRRTEEVVVGKTQFRMFQELYYLAFVYLAGSIYLGKKGNEVRTKIRQILSINNRAEDLLLKRLKKMDLIEQTHNLVTPKNKKFAEYILDQLVKHEEIDLDNVVRQFLNLKS